MLGTLGIFGQTALQSWRWRYIYRTPGPPFSRSLWQWQALLVAIRLAIAKLRPKLEPLLAKKSLTKAATLLALEL